MIEYFIWILCGVGLFLFGIYFLGANLNKISELFGLKKLFSSGIKCFSFGLFSAALTQSSSAINSLTVQFCDEKLMEKKFAYYSVMGANIGTTVSAYLILLAHFSVTNVFLISELIFAYLLLISKSEKTKIVSIMGASVSLLFIGIKIISDAVPGIIALIDPTFFAGINPFFILFLGIIFTAVCQSSSLVSILVIILTGSGIISLESAIFMIMGANVGTCSTALLSSVGKSRLGKNVAVFNLLLNVFGMAINMISYYIHALDWLDFLNVSDQFKVAIFNTYFNLSTVLLSFPFVSDIASGGFKKIFAIETNKSGEK